MIIGNAIYLGGTSLPELTSPAVAGDIRYGKQSIDGDGEVLVGTIPDYEGETDTGSVIPVDTGANGLYKAVMLNDATELVDDSITELPDDALCYQTKLVKLSLPNLISTGARALVGCSNLTGIVNLGQAIIGAGIFQNACRRTTVLKFKKNADSANNSLTSIKASYLWLPTVQEISFNYMLNSATNLAAVQFDTITAMPLSYTYYVNNLKTFIIRTPTGCTLKSRGTMATDIKYYVPKDILISFYSTATNWVTDYNAGRIVGIDEDTTGTVGTPFTPTTSATVDHWDMVELQSYSVGTVDTATGSITPTHDGRLLIRGLDANDEIVHVTYLQIGTGFDEEANLAD